MPAVWDIKRIKEVLPQDYPFLFIDKVLEIDTQKKMVKCLKNATINDYFFAGHFPSRPVMPGAIIIEAMAQGAIILYSVLKPEIAKKRPDYYLGKVEAKFLTPVNVGEQLIIEVYGEKILDTASIVNTSVRVNKKVVAQARISFGVKF